MNTNADMNKEKLARSLKKLGMQDLAKERAEENGTLMYFTGKN